MLPPTIPTSFIPHSTPAGVRHDGSSSSGMFSIFSYIILCFVFISAIGIFFYGRALSADEAVKSEELAKAEASIDPTIADSFIRLRDRLISGKNLLEKHVAFTGFFTLLGELTPTTVRLASVHILVDDSDTIKLEGSGTAKSFNALAAASIAFANGGHIKNAIFSNIKVNTKDNSVSFGLSATIDPKIVSFSPSAPVVSAQASSTPSVATSTTQTTL
jgi:hypothetical protein